jgi:hypothetical protein
MNTKQPIKIWETILRTSLNFKHCRVDREDFLKEVLKVNCSDEVINKAILTSPIDAEIPRYVISDIAKEVISKDLAKVTGLSFVAGLPGGLSMLGSIPADLIQFFVNSIQIAQKLAYLYGWKDFFESEADISQETLSKITLFTGVMFGAPNAEKALNALKEMDTDDSTKDIRIGFSNLEIDFSFSQTTVREHGLLQLIEYLAKWIGVKIARSRFTSGALRYVPLIGGIVSGGISYLSFKDMTSRLHDYLRQ